MRFANIPPFMQMVYDAFGASRMMWGSAFPPVAGREGYHNAPYWTMEYINYRSDDDKEWVFARQPLPCSNLRG